MINGNQSRRPNSKMYPVSKRAQAVLPIGKITVKTKKPSVLLKRTAMKYRKIWHSSKNTRKSRWSMIWREMADLHSWKKSISNKEIGIPSWPSRSASSNSRRWNSGFSGILLGRYSQRSIRIMTPKRKSISTALISQKPKVLLDNS